MNLRWAVGCCVVLTICLSHARAAAPQAAVADALSSYVAARDDVFKWEETSRTEMLGLRQIQLTLTSQTWHGTTWKHRVVILLPQQIRNPNHALLFINGGSWRGDEAAAQPQKPKMNAETVALAAAAQHLGSPIVILSNVPFQPIEGKREDALIAYTFDQYLKTMDPTWPLLLPMVKSTVRAMDAVQAHLKETEKLDIQRFTVTGASKRGWTTWLTAAADPRVAAAAPMVIDLLNMTEQSKHQMEVWGEHSMQIRDYTELDIPRRLGTEIGKMLVRIVDPFSYRDRLTQPKLIIVGTNDQYWPVDASNQYWDQLQGEKFLTIVPNAGHDLARDFPRVVGSLVALHQYAAGQRTMPKMEWAFSEHKQGQKLRVTCDVPPQSANLWIARAPSKDFRQARWTRSMMTRRDGGYEAVLAPKSGEYIAAFGEFVFPGAPALCLSTNVKVVGK